MLATAGSPLRHPHYFSGADEYLVWERDVARFGHDLQRVQSFFETLLANAADEDTLHKQLYSLIATEHVPQGPAYTVGWKMAAVVERHFGRGVLVEAMCDPRELLRLYNEAALTIAHAGGDPLPRWSDAFLQALRSE